MGLRAEQAAKVRVLVMTGYGLNCEDETAAGFERLGCTVERRHVGDLIVEPSAETFSRWDILAFIGGFSFGDHVASGRVYANRLRYRLGEGLARFVDRGGLAVGMCNGFQTMVKLGILPGLDRPEGALAPQQASLVPNERLGYYDGWVTMRADAESPCVWTRGVELIDLPSRHGEGQLVYGSSEVSAQLQRAHQIQHPGARLAVQVRRGLVGDDEDRRLHERTGDRHPLLLSTRQVVGQFAHLILQADGAQPLPGLQKWPSTECCAQSTAR